MSAVVRHATRDDGAEWHRMRVALYGDDCPFDETHAWFDAVDSGRPHPLLVAVLVADDGNGELSGFAEIGARNYAEGCTSSPVAYLEGWYVDPNRRRRGTGRSLADAALDWCRANGYTEIASDAAPDNDVSLTAHRRLGFAIVESQVCLRRSL